MNSKYDPQARTAYFTARHKQLSDEMKLWIDSHGDATDMQRHLRMKQYERDLYDWATEMEREKEDMLKEIDRMKKVLADKQQN